MPRKALADTVYAQLFYQAWSPRILLDEQGRIVEVNQRFMELTGWNRSCIHTVNFFNYISSWPKKNKTKKPHPPEQGVVRLISQDDPHAAKFFSFCCKPLDTLRKRYYTVHLQPMEDTGEELIHQIIKTNKESESQNKAKSAFLANISHEIRTPMNGIMGMTDLVLQSELDEEQREYMNIIKMSADSLLRIINDILDFSKLESGKMSLEEISYNLKELMDQISAFFRPQLESRGLTFQCEMDRVLPEQIKGDPLRLKQILMNLIGNAMKFTAQGGVELRITGIRKYRNRWELHFEVIDTGIGIPKEKQADLFKSFSQADVSTARKYGGTGLGLAISSALVSQMGGTLQVNSRPGEGSNFNFTLPIISTRETQEEEKMGFTHIPLEKNQNIHVLIVEDNRVNRLLACRLLQKKDFQVSEAESGPKGLAKYKSCRPDLVLMDIHMPEWDGYRVLREIRKYEEEHQLPEIPLIALTAMAMKGDRNKLLKAGFAEHVSKPFEPEDLFSKIHGLLDSGVDK